MKDTIKKILKEFKTNIGKGRYYGCHILIIFITIILSLEPLFFGAILRELEQYYLVGNFNISLIMKITVTWVLYTLIFSVVKYFILYESITKSILLDYKISIKKYCSEATQMTMKTYLGKKIGSIYKLIDRGTDDKLFFLFRYFEQYLYSSVQIVCISIILFYIDYRMALITLSFVPIIMCIGYYFVGITGPKQLDLTKKWENIFEIVGNAMSNFSLFKILGLQKDFKKQIDSKTDQVHSRQMQVNRAWVASDVYIIISVMLVRILVLVTGMYFISQESLSLAELFVVFSYIGWIYFPLGFIFSELRNSVKQLTEVDRLYSNFHQMEKEQDIDSGIEISPSISKIEFKNVNFSYTPEKQILHNLNFEVKKGERIALVGNTGSGKSTIVNLLLKFWDIDSGEVFLGKHKIEELKKTSLRKNVGVVSQDNSLFNLSIRDNLTFAKTDATEDELRDALRNAEAHFVFDLPSGIDTVIGERGLKLSGGEKQRISIARLFLKNPEILILDEATSALDNRTESLIQKSLDRLLEGKASIIIAHRLSTIQNADVIYVLENGTIVESGNYNELMQNKGTFHNIANPENLIIG